MSVQPGQLPPPADGISRSTHIFFGLCGGICLGFGIWAWFGQLDIVSVATGEAKPASQVKEVQHLEGGIVAAILVREGAKVEAGQSLIELETTRTGADLYELQVRLANLTIEAIRHEAEANGRTKLEIPAELTETRPAVVERARNLFETRMKRYESEVVSQKELITQRRQEVREIKARLLNSGKSLSLLNEQIKISEGRLLIKK